MKEKEEDTAMKCVQVVTLAVAGALVVLSSYAQQAAVQSNSDQNTLRTMAIKNAAPINAISADVQKIIDCGNQGKFYVDGVCKSPSLDADALPPKLAGLVVRPISGNKSNSWWGNCEHGNMYCSVSCKDGKTSWVEIINGQYQPYYCPSITSASGESTCGNVDSWWSTGSGKNCWKSLPSDAQNSTVIYTDAWGNNPETVTGYPRGI